MKNTFVIAWRSATSERSGRGTALLLGDAAATGRGKKLMTRQEAETLAAELNQDYPAFIHEVVDTQSGSAMVETAEAA